MFSDYVFTTVMFLDYGKNSENCPDDYVYAYGMDYNWRDSFTNQVIDPVDLYLARVHKDHVMDRTRWEFFTGTGTDGQPGWSGAVSYTHLDVYKRQPRCRAICLLPPAPP